MIRDSVRVAYPLLTAIFAVGLVACAGGKDAGGDRGSADSSPAESEPAMQPPAPVPPSTSTGPQLDPANLQSSLEYDSATNTVKFPIVAGLTSDNNAWNFNGYSNGKIRIIVPVGAKIEMPFSNMDGNAPHSFGVIAGSASAMPAAPGKVVFPGAETRRYEAGMRAGETDIVRFTAVIAGKYLLVCGVPGHATGGMWIWFEVSAKARRPEIRVA
ncbi:MAG: sulfocyanin-like copper-binding protein [Gemmatimonadaceae bacterium]